MTAILDLYVVNGMIEETIFAHLPDHELIEENQVFRNQAGQTFFPMPAWGLNSTRSGRAMSMADLDMDGDLDIVVNNLRGPAQLFENQLCGGVSLQVALAQPDVQNRDAIGARVGLLTDSGMIYREVRAAGGYLAGDAPIVHFGFPAGADLVQLEIQWPDGAMSVVEDVAAGTMCGLSGSEKWSIDNCRWSMVGESGSSTAFTQYDYAFFEVGNPQYS